MGKEKCSDQDSADSNRESADGNDYPDEDEDCERDFHYYGSDSDDSDRGARMQNSDSDVDEDEAARRYNRKHGAKQGKHGISQAWLDRL
mmetsp:Transcript_577/g.739  ORF Transcript_577/g.739 Transcript_577/m.739 type:complete len:89 (+) Transcript_577:962-1228(+)|eukprot:CAMPEP_0185581508 /NCGR_PEP_ID=MMETSP0434-20130131/18363_1 /TAXON_ID=626734 ORGANISM="Favella taraikaensis, Strain Fe Narragansett Bay" /NCGR_SAMPLE_ID=MMETSP0434 /ASSEMBLY_ACC=CAM_ASM_000379 /LENGTH=88 /DNA_ID=CAMNT_0028200077 /DNA_START=914 /DNA_END=1180 /DNA_ORIENTATION=-